MTVLASAISDRQDSSARHRAQPTPTHPGLPALVVLVVAAGAFAFASTSLADAPPNEYGLLAAASPALLASILLTALGFAMAIRANNFRVAGLAVFLMIVVQRLPTAIGTDGPLYPWVYKHLGVVDYIQHTNALAPGVDVYNDWPGLFGLTAWFSDLTGLSPTTFAQWFTPGWHLLFAVLIFAAARAWDLDRMQAMVAVFIAASVNWVAQDYFSPQGTAMLLAVGVIIVMGHSRQRPVAVVILILLFTSVVISHQLTPFWLLAAIGLLAVTKRLKPWWIFLPLSVILLAFVASNYSAISGFLDFSGNVVDNAKSNVPTVGSAGQQLMSMMVRVLSGAMWLSTAAVLAYRAYRRQPFFALGVLALSPMLIIAGANYGGEAIFRVFLYSLVGSSIILAPGLLGLLQGRPAAFGTALSVVLVATALSAQGYFGGWFAYLMPRAQVEAVDKVLMEADFPAYVSTPVPSWPQRGNWRYVDYARFKDSYDHSFIVQQQLMGAEFDARTDYPLLTQMVGERTDASTYLVLTDQMDQYAHYFGVLKPVGMQNLRKQALEDPFWKLVFDADGVMVFRHDIEVDSHLGVR
ncbi:hypothetical protein BH11ACT7_BH11ACT7_16230 [soil metagenome]